MHNSLLFWPVAFMPHEISKIFDPFSMWNFLLSLFLSLPIDSECVVRFGFDAKLFFAVLPNHFPVFMVPIYTKLLKWFHWSNVLSTLLFFYFFFFLSVCVTNWILYVQGNARQTNQRYRNQRLALSSQQNLFAPSPNRVCTCWMKKIQWKWP